MSEKSEEYEGPDMVKSFAEIVADTQPPNETKKISEGKVLQIESILKSSEADANRAKCKACALLCCVCFIPPCGPCISLALMIDYFCCGGECLECCDD